MAEPSNKRRKVEYETSGQEDDDASLASFGDSDNQDDEQEYGTDFAELDGEPPGSSATDDELSEAMDEHEEQKEEETNVSADRAAGKISTTTSLRVPEIRGSQKGLKRSTYATGTFKSTVFGLQVDELLEHIRPRRGKKEAEAEAILHKLKSAIEKIPSREPLSVDDAERQLLMSNKVAIPFPNPRPSKDAKFKLEYAKPASVNVGGSHLLKPRSRSKKTIEIDMAVTMPSSLFQFKDYLNYRYFYKRAYYLACVGAGLKDLFAKDFLISYRNFHNDPLKPFIVITPANLTDGNTREASTSKWQINILPCMSENVFTGDKLLPNKNCVRPQTDGLTNGASPDMARTATSFYNATLRSDMLMASYSKLLNDASKACESFQDTCLLGSTWIRQRGLASDIHAGGFGNFEWSVLVALLLQSGGPGGRPLLSEGYSSYQLFKATLQLLARTDFTKQPFVVGTSGEISKPLNHEAPILWDSTRKHNLLYKMMPWSYKLLRRDARTTLTMLGDQQFDGFDATFIVRTDGPLYRYDYLLEFCASFVGGSDIQHDHAALEAYQKLYSTLQRGLGDRINHIDIIPQWSESWELSSASRSYSTERKLLVGFVVNPDTISRTIDHGPSAEEKKEASTFRHFWGEKAELRRFKDGSIQECLIWSAKEGDPYVLEQIVRYVITKHLGDDVEQRIKFFGDGFRGVLAQSSGITPFQSIMEAFKKLEIDIRNLDGLPISVRQIMPADAQLRYASTTLRSGGRKPTPADVVIQFESSARWPDDLVAIQRTKLAFLLSLSKQIQRSLDSVTARVGLENEEHDTLNQGFLDVIYDSGAAFRLRVHHDREQTLLECRLKDNALDPRSREISSLGLAKYKRDYIKTPLHTQAIAGLCRRHAAMSGTIRVMKKWIASHLLSNHVAAEVIELLVARAFTQPWPWQVPSSVQTGFLRTLFWISRWDWRSEPLIVDLSGSNELKQPDYQSITAKFEAWRQLDPALDRVVLFAASNVDHEGTTWTDGRPSKVVIGRMVALANAACAEVEQKQLLLDPASLFVSPLSDFDFVIHLRPGFVGKKPHRNHAAQNGVAFKNLEPDFMDDSSRVGFDPVHDFVHEINALYGSAMLLFSGGYERPLVAGLWSPQTATRSWKLNLAYSTTPVKWSDKDEVQAEPNKEAILAEIARFGGDLVRDIVVHGR